jgi:aspartyl protease family protein
MALLDLFPPPLADIRLLHAYLNISRGENMRSVDPVQLIYLTVLAMAVIGWFIAENRNNLNNVLKQGIVWLLLIVGLMAGYGLWDDIQRDNSRAQYIGPAGQIEVPRQGDGHYYLTLMLNGVPVDFMIDTGATSVALSQADAMRIGTDPATLRYTSTAYTANGVVRTARLEGVEFELNGMRDRGVETFVSQGDQDGSLLGMSYLSRYSKIEITGDRLMLIR